MNPLDAVLGLVAFEAHQFALADQVGLQSFSDFDYDLVGRLGDPSAVYSDARVISVQVETVDNLIDQGRIPPPDLAKIDVEGAELAVLTGMDRTLREKRPILIIELHGPEIERAHVAGGGVGFAVQAGAGLRVTVLVRGG